MKTAEQWIAHIRKQNGWAFPGPADIRAVQADAIRHAGDEVLAARKRVKIREVKEILGLLAEALHMDAYKLAKP